MTQNVWQDLTHSTPIPREIERPILTPTQRVTLEAMVRRDEIVTHTNSGRGLHRNGWAAPTPDGTAWMITLAGIQAYLRWARGRRDMTPGKWRHLCAAAGRTVLAAMDRERRA